MSGHRFRVGASVIGGLVLCLGVAAGPRARAAGPAPAPAAADKTDVVLTKARHAIDSEQLDAALDLLKQAVPKNADQAAKVDLLIGEIFLKVGKPAKAIDFFEHAAESTMNDTDAYVGMAQSELKLGNVARARADAEMALHQNADKAGAHLVLAQADDRSGNVAAARSRFEELSRTRPKNESIALAHAEFLFNRGDVHPAIKRLDDYIAINPTSGAVRDALGRYLWAVGKHDAAMRQRALAASLFLSKGNTYRAEPIVAWVKLRDSTGKYLKAIHSPEQLYREAVAPKEAPAPETAPQAAPAPEAKPQQQPKPKPQPQPQEPQPQAHPAPAPEPAPEPQLVRLEPLPIPPGALYSQGSGFIVGNGDYVVTNHHVVRGTTMIAVRNGLGQVRRAHVVRLGQTDDLAVLKLDRPFPAADAVPTSAMGDPRAGRSAIVLGFPMAGILGEQMPSLTNGIVSKTTGFENNPTTFILSTKVNKGNSGGPVFDNHGNLIGVVVSKLDTLKIYEQRGFIPEDVNQAIKISRVFALMGWPGGTSSSETRGQISYEQLYQEMLPKVVIVAGVLKEEAHK